MKDSPQPEWRNPIPVYAFVNGYAAKIYGHSLKEHMTNIPASIRAQLLAKALHGYEDSPFIRLGRLGRAGNSGARSIGPRVMKTWPPARLRHPVIKPSDIERLSDPDPITAGSVSLLMRFNRELVKLGLEPKIRAGSVTSVVAGMIGVEKLMKWYFKEPDAVKIAYEKATRFLIRTAEETVAEFGPECTATLSAPWDSNDLISPAIFEKFAIPYMERVLSALMDLGVTSVRAHLCGNHHGNLSAWTRLPWPEGTSSPLETKWTLPPRPRLSDTGSGFAEMFQPPFWPLDATMMSIRPHGNAWNRGGGFAGRIRAHARLRNAYARPAAERSGPGRCVPWILTEQRVAGCNEDALGSYAPNRGGNQTVGIRSFSDGELLILLSIPLSFSSFCAFLKST